MVEWEAAALGTGGVRWVSIGSATVEEETYGVGEKMTFEGGRPKPLIVSIALQLQVLLVGRFQKLKSHEYRASSANNQSYDMVRPSSIVPKPKYTPNPTPTAHVTNVYTMGLIVTRTAVIGGV